MADRRRLVELSMVPPLAAEVAAQIEAAGGTPYTDADAQNAIKNKTQVAALTSLTGTVGTANDAMIAVPASTLATDFATQKTSLDAAITAINNNLADLQAKVNAIMAALKA